MNETRKERRGFASMSAEKQREIASKGGRAAHQKGTAHEWSSDEAREAGRKGGMASRGGRGKLPITSSASSLSSVESIPSSDDTEPAA
ncbi:MAG TPA: KGG domain-containing protein [Vicinamibacterales bacterium]|nr:KGG domain-containing protein [Vicinamibacterales bacterium]